MGWISLSLSVPTLERTQHSREHALQAVSPRKSERAFHGMRRSRVTHAPRPRSRSDARTRGWPPRQTAERVSNESGDGRRAETVVKEQIKHNSHRHTHTHTHSHHSSFPHRSCVAGPRMGCCQVCKERMQSGTLFIAPHTANAFDNLGT